MRACAIDRAERPRPAGVCLESCTCSCRAANPAMQRPLKARAHPCRVVARQPSFCHPAGHRARMPPWPLQQKRSGADRRARHHRAAVTRQLACCHPVGRRDCMPPWPLQLEREGAVRRAWHQRADPQARTPTWPVLPQMEAGASHVFVFVASRQLPLPRASASQRPLAGRQPSTHRQLSRQTRAIGR